MRPVYPFRFCRSSAALCSTSSLTVSRAPFQQALESAVESLLSKLLTSTASCSRRCRSSATCPRSLLQWKSASTSDANASR